MPRVPRMRTDLALPSGDFVSMVRSIQNKTGRQSWRKGQQPPCHGIDHEKPCALLEQACALLEQACALLEQACALLEQAYALLGCRRRLPARTSLRQAIR